MNKKESGFYPILFTSIRIQDVERHYILYPFAGFRQFDICEREDHHRAIAISTRKNSIFEQVRYVTFGLFDLWNSLYMWIKVIKNFCTLMFFLFAMWGARSNMDIKYSEGQRCVLSTCSFAKHPAFKQRHDFIRTAWPIIFAAKKKQMVPDESDDAMKKMIEKHYRQYVNSG